MDQIEIEQRERKSLDLDPNYGVLLELDMLLMLAMMGLALVLLQLLGLDHLLVDPLLSLSLSLLLALHLEDPRH